MRKTLLLLSAILLATCAGAQGKHGKKAQPKSRLITGATVPVVAVRMGSSAYTDSTGQVWASDTACSPFNIAAPQGLQVLKALPAATDQALYQVQKWNAGTMTCGYSVPNGSYQVTLKFAEMWFINASRCSVATCIGQRKFDVAINGVKVLTAFDIVAAAGAPLTAVDETFPTTVTNGSVSVVFSTATGYPNNPTIGAIEIAPNAVVSPPVITTQPQPETVTVGQAGSFAVAAAGTGLTYQWQKNGTVIPGANAAAYATPPTTQADAGSSFIVVVSNSAGSVASSPASLTVTPITGHLDNGQTTVVTWNAVDVLVGQCGTTASCTSTISSTGTASATFTIKIAASNPLVITTSSLPNGTCGQAYAATLAANGGSPPYSWSIVAGTLPAALALNVTTGAISGTVAPCTSSFSDSVTFQVKDTAGLTFQKALALDPHRHIRRYIPLPPQ